MPEQARDGYHRTPRSDVALTPRELDVLTFIARGLDNPEIARRMWISTTTVATHVAHILRARNRAHAAALGCFAGLISPEGRGPVVNGEQFALGYSHHGALYEQANRQSAEERAAARERVAQVIGWPR